MNTILHNPILLYLLVIGAMCLLHTVLIGLLLWTGHCKYSFKEATKKVMPSQILWISVGFWGMQLVNFIFKL